MQTTNFSFFSTRGAGRAAVGVFVICMLIISGLFWGGSGASGKIKVDPRSPISPESLEGLEMWRLNLSSGFARWNSYYCGTSSYDAAWIGFVGGRDVCMIYKVRDNEFWLVKGDLFIPLSTDIIFLQISAGETEFIFFGCDEGALICSNPVIMPPSSGLNISVKDNLVIETVSAEDASVEPEGVEKLRERVARLSNSSWFAKLCYVTDTLSYSDNCQDENAPPVNFAVRKADLDTRNSFTLTWYWDSADSNGPRNFPASVYFRDIETTSPVKVTCAISEARWITAEEGYQTYTCAGHTLEFQGNFIIIGSDETAAASGGTILSLPKPEIHVVAMEVTQGVQNWENTVTLVKDRRTAVRVFMETSVLPRKITATLEGSKIRGSARTDFAGEPPVNHFRKVEVRPNVVEYRENIDSSLNFILPDKWINIREDEKCPGKGDKEEMPPGGIVSLIPKNSQRPGGAASWYTGGDYDGLGLRSITGYRRNSGGHEVGHLLGQEHPIRDRSEKNEKGFYDGTCGEHSSATEIYPYYEYKKVEEKEGENVYNWLPTLGPLGDARTEIWGLDIRYIKSWND